MKIELNSPFAREKIKAEQALMQVLDPELGVNIIDLGLVYDIDFSTTAMALVKMTFSTPHCPLGEAIQQRVLHALSAAFPTFAIHIEIVWEPAWSYDMISAAGKEALGMA